jgi:hypothetical protein
MLPENSGGGEDDRQAGGVGDLLAGEVPGDFGIDRARGKGLSRGSVKPGLYHGISSSLWGTP